MTSHADRIALLTRLEMMADAERARAEARRLDEYRRVVLGELEPECWPEPLPLRVTCRELEEWNDARARF